MEPVLVRELLSLSDFDISLSILIVHHPNASLHLFLVHLGPGVRPYS